MRMILRRAALFALLMAAALDGQEKKVLFLTHSAGFVHDVVKRPAPDQLSLAELELTAMLKGRYQVDCTQDCAVLTAENLEKYDVVVFYTTGELPAPAGGAAALVDWVRSGGGFVGIHCAADTWYGVPAYGEMVGASFESHPWHQAVRVDVLDPAHPATAHLGASFELADEIYQFKNLAPEPLQVLLSLDPKSVDASKGNAAAHPLAWCREYGSGRVVYAALGHRDTVWKDERFRKHLLGAIDWVAAKGSWSMRAPAGADVLLGTQARFTHRDGAPARWTLENGVLEVVPKAGDLISKDTFEDFRLHVEFRVPEHPPADQGQARGNSGVYLQDRYEIQVLDSFGLESKTDGCGAIYGVKAPATNACRKPGQWQSYDVAFTAAQFHEYGKKIAKARASVWQNGIKIHDDVEIGGPTGGGEMEMPAPGPIRLQDHGNLVAYRNIWVVSRPRARSR